MPISQFIWRNYRAPDAKIANFDEKLVKSALFAQTIFVNNTDSISPLSSLNHQPELFPTKTRGQSQKPAPIRSGPHK